jgi:hypothetical protein
MILDGGCKDGGEVDVEGSPSLVGDEYKFCGC